VVGGGSTNEARSCGRRKVRDKVSKEDQSKSGYLIFGPMGEQRKRQKETLIKYQRAQRGQMKGEWKRAVRVRRKTDAEENTGTPLTDQNTFQPTGPAKKRGRRSETSEKGGRRNSRADTKIIIMGRVFCPHEDLCGCREGREWRSRSWGISGKP